MFLIINFNFVQIKFGFHSVWTENPSVTKTYFLGKEQKEEKNVAQIENKDKSINYFIKKK